MSTRSNKWYSYLLCLCYIKLLLRGSIKGAKYSGSQLGIIYYIYPLSFLLEEAAPFRGSRSILSYGSITRQRIVLRHRLLKEPESPKTRTLRETFEESFVIWISDAKPRA